MDNYILELDHITKVFPGVKALNEVCLNVRPGEVLALVGENGAGKSTLINIISGVFGPTSGEIRVEGKKVKVQQPSDAFELGIGVVHQERNLIETFNVAENICFMDLTASKTRKVDREAMRKKAKAAMERIQLDLDPDEPVANLTAGKKQMLEIARAISMNSKLLLLDEPTASISLLEARTLLKTVKKLRSEGVAIIYISHKLEEIEEIADRVTVIRDGNNVGHTLQKDEITRELLIELMVGRKQQAAAHESQDCTDRPVVVEAREIASKLNPIPKSFNLHKGEILGWYGLVGAGRTELARELIGIDPIKSGELLINGVSAKVRSYEEAIKKYKLCYISENRKEEGLFLPHTISNNMGIIALEKISNKAGFISYKIQDQLTQKYKDQLSIKAESIHTEVASLSGGNQQKICIAKGLCEEPEIMVVDEPTVGIDVQTKAEIHELIYDLAQKGISVIVISSDLMELINLADRVIVFRDNEIQGEYFNSKNYEEMSTKIMDKILQ